MRDSKFVAGLVLVAGIALLALLPRPAQAGRSAFSAVATVKKTKHFSRFLTGETWDVYMRGMNGNLFMLHFHNTNPLEVVTNGERVKVVYVQETDQCETGYVDEVISLVEEK